MAGKVGFIGLGTMGGPMAANLAKGNVPLVVFDVSAAACHGRGEARRRDGRRLAGRPSRGRSACSSRRCPTTTSCARTYLGPNGVAEGGAAGLVTCDCSTVSPEATLEVAAGLARRSIVHMDTPMLGSQPQAVSGEIFFIVGGDRARLDTIKPYLDLMGRLPHVRRASASGNRVKLLHNGLAAVTATAVAETVATCVQSGVDPYVFYDVVKNGGGMAFGTYFDRRVKRMLDGDFSPTFMAELMLKDARLALDLARAAKVPAPILEETTRTYEDAVAGGWGKEDFSAVTHVIEKRIGRKVSKPK